MGMHHKGHRVTKLPVWLQWQVFCGIGWYNWTQIGFKDLNRAVQQDRMFGFDTGPIVVFCTTALAHNSGSMVYVKIGRWTVDRCAAICQNSSGIFNFSKALYRPPLWSSGQSFWLQIQRSWVWFLALSDFLRSKGSGTGSTQPREDNWGATCMKK
jgi:hypothetical protein